MQIEIQLFVVHGHENTHIASSANCQILVARSTNSNRFILACQTKQSFITFLKMAKLDAQILAAAKAE